MTSTVVVKRCAPGPVDPGLAFDNLGQFASRYKKLKAVSAENRITFADFERMHAEKRVVVRCKKWLPPWAFNDQQLRTVILHRGWTYVLGGVQAFQCIEAVMLTDWQVFDHSMILAQVG
jgi:hypothetical protein